MKDESPAVAGHLTGKWRFKCPHCGTVHQQANTIGRCADRFVETMINGHVSLGSPEMFRIGNQFEAARKGMLERYGEIEALVGRVEAKHFGLDPELFCRVENQQEATKLVLDELKKFVDQRAVEFDPIFQEVEKFRRELEAAPVLELGDRVKVSKQPKSKMSYRSTGGVAVTVDEVEISTKTIQAYYAHQIENSVARRRLLRDWLDLEYIDVDGNKAVLTRYENGVGVRPRPDGKLEGATFKKKAETESWVGVDE